MDVADAERASGPTSASSISIRREDDPEPLRTAALGLRDLLDERGLPTAVKTSGSKGFHIVVPLKRTDVPRASAASPPASPPS